MEISNFMMIYPVFLLCIYIATYFIANSLNKKHLWNYPEYKSYTWGYFLGISYIINGVIGFSTYIFLIVYSQFDNPPNQIILGLVISALAIFFGIFTCLKDKWALVLITIFNVPIFWIINYFYIKKRPYLAKNYHHHSPKKSESKINDQVLTDKNQETNIKFKSPSNNNSIEQLEKIKKLLDDGAITIVEYEKLKQKILSQL